jgi:hypothetical protein
MATASTTGAQRNSDCSSASRYNLSTCRVGVAPASGCTAGPPAEPTLRPSTSSSSDQGRKCTACTTTGRCSHSCNWVCSCQRKTGGKASQPSSQAAAHKPNSQAKGRRQRRGMNAVKRWTGEVLEAGGVMPASFTQVPGLGNLSMRAWAQERSAVTIMFCGIGVQLSSLLNFGETSSTQQRSDYCQ